MNLKLLERRRDLLNWRARGVSLVDVVKELAGKYDISPRAVYYDWQNRKAWMEGFLDIQDKEALLLELYSNHREIYRLASLEYLQGDNSSAKIGALHLLRELNMDFLDMIVVRDNSRRLRELEEKARSGGVFL